MKGMVINMGEKRYIISDAAKLIEVESHVLRYWEEELNVDVPRNEMGHRYYTDFYIDLFRKVKELKEGGFQLKAIKMLIPELMEMDRQSNVDTNTLKEELFDRITEGQKSEYISEVRQDTDNGNVVYQPVNNKTDEQAVAENMSGIADNDVHSTNTTGTELSKMSDTSVDTGQDKNSKLQQFQTIITEVVSNALRENTGMLGKEVGDIVSDNVIKEMDYLMHLREKQEEERFKKLDETIRNYQMVSRERSKIKKGLFAKLKKDD